MERPRLVAGVVVVVRVADPRYYSADLNATHTALPAGAQGRSQRPTGYQRKRSTPDLKGGRALNRHRQSIAAPAGGSDL